MRLGALLWLAGALGGAAPAGPSQPSPRGPSAGERRVGGKSPVRAGDRERSRAYRLERVFPAQAFLRPALIAHMPGEPERVLVLEQDGRIKSFSVKAPDEPAQVLLDLSERVLSPSDGGFGERGLLGLAFDPRFETSRRVIVNYTRAPDGDTVISRLTLPDRARTTIHEKVLLVIDQPYANHNGGGVAFGPDGMLYVGMGDGGSANDPQGRAQDLGSLLGKFLRIDVTGRADPPLAYAIPGDNPFVSAPGARGEVWAYGLRNPWRFAFDPVGGALWAGDVGQNRYEEVDVIVRGGNYGWACREGLHPGPRPKDCTGGELVEPVSEYGHDDGISITGGVVYRGKAHEALTGAFIYGDYGSGVVWAVRRDASGKGIVERLVDGELNISSFGTDAGGEVYALDHGAGGQETGIYRLVR